MIVDSDGVVHVVLNDDTWCGRMWFHPERYRIISGWQAVTRGLDDEPDDKHATCVVCAAKAR